MKPFFTGVVNTPQCDTSTIPYFSCFKKVDAYSSTSADCNINEGRCVVRADSAHIYYWPPASTAAGDDLCVQGSAAVPTTITSPTVLRTQVVDVGQGRLVTMTSPSAYVAFNKVSAVVSYGKGPPPGYSTFFNMVLTMDPAQMSTVEIHAAG